MNATMITTDTESPVFDCEQTVRRLWDYLDGQLGALDVAAVDAHLAECDRCPQHFAFERRFLAAVREARSEMPVADANALERLRTRVVSVLAAAGELRTPESHA